MIANVRSASFALVLTIKIYCGSFLLVLNEDGFFLKFLMNLLLYGVTLVVETKHVELFGFLADLLDFGQ